MDYFLINFAMIFLISAVLLTETKYITLQGICTLLFLSSIVTHFVINPIQIYNQVSEHQFPMSLFILLMILFFALVLKLHLIIKKNKQMNNMEKRNTYD